MSYNGYTNYETWAVMLWIDNNESSSSYWRQVAAETYHHLAAEQSHFSREDDAICLLTDKLKESYQYQMETILDRAQGDGTVWADLLNASLCAVDFSQVAKNLMEGIVAVPS
jgi:hypothetical protein